MGVAASVVDGFFQILAEFLVNKMFDAMCRFVNVVERKPKVLDKIRFPKAVRSDQGPCRSTAHIGELKTLLDADNVSLSNERGDAPSRNKASSQGLYG